MTSKEKKPPLTPETTFCLNLDCPARGQIGEGNIGVHSQKDRRYICRECKLTFSATTGTLIYRLRKGADLITLVVKLLSHGCPIQAIVFAFGLDERRVRNWFEKSGQHSKLVHQHLVEQPRPVGQVQCDELRIKLQGAIIWMGMAIMVQNRLWLGGDASASRDSETEHKSLRLPGLTGGHKWLERTPAMASGITDHCWTVDELLSFKVPPPSREPKRPRGRPNWGPKKPRWHPRKAPKSEVGGGVNDHG